MPRLPPAVPAPRAAGVRLGVRADGRRLAMGGLLAAALAGNATAAPMADPPAPPIATDAGAGGTLGRTLRVDTEAAQRDVEVLMDTRTRAEGDPPRPTGGLPAAQRGAAGARPGGAPPDATGAAEDSARPGDAGGLRAALPGPVREAALWLREHRLWLLGGLVLVAVLAASVPLWRRRQAAAAERRLRALAAQPRAPQRRRRSSRH